MNSVNSVNSVNSIDTTQQKLEYLNYLKSILSKEIKADPYNSQDFLRKDNNQKYSETNRDNILRHLLYYTYSATASEIENHREINRYLSEIKALLEEHVNKDKKIDAPASP
jgi:hypothetical protein